MIRSSVKEGHTFGTQTGRISNVLLVVSFDDKPALQQNTRAYLKHRVWRIRPRKRRVSSLCERLILFSEVLNGGNRTV